MPGSCLPAACTTDADESEHDQKDLVTSWVTERRSTLNGLFQLNSSPLMARVAARMDLRFVTGYQIIVGTLSSICLRVLYH